MTEELSRRIAPQGVGEISLMVLAPDLAGAALAVSQIRFANAIGDILTAASQDSMPPLPFYYYI
jgi:hypothetical protein